MEQQAEAVYEGGVLRLLSPVSLTESQMVKVIISESLSAGSQRDLKVVESARVELAAIQDVPILEELRFMLASIPGSLSDEVIAERGER